MVETVLFYLASRGRGGELDYSDELFVCTIFEHCAFSSIVSRFIVYSSLSFLQGEHT